MKYFAFYYQLLTARNSQLWNEVRWGIEIEADEIQIGCKRLIHAPVILTPIEYYLSFKEYASCLPNFVENVKEVMKGPFLQVWLGWQRIAGPPPYWPSGE